MKKIIWSIVFAPFFLVSQNADECNQLSKQQNRSEEPKSRFAAEFKYHEPKKDIENRLDCCEKIGRIVMYLFPLDQYKIEDKKNK